MRCPLQVASIMPAPSTFDWAIRILPGARDKIRSREPWRTTTVMETVTRYTGIGVAIFVVGSGICEKDDAHRSGRDPYFVCCGTRRRPAFRGYWGSVDGTLIKARAVPAIRPSIFAAHNVTNTRMPRTTDPVARRHQEVEITSRGSPIAFENRSGLV